MTRCPHCGERVLIEWDVVLRRWDCNVCGKWWQEAGMHTSTAWRVLSGTGAALVLAGIVRPAVAYYPAVCYSDLWWLFWECWVLAP